MIQGFAPTVRAARATSSPISAQQLEATAAAAEFDYDLAIVGGGIAGVTLAAALKNSGLSIALIEAQSQSEAAAKGQAYAIHLLSSRIYQGIGVWDAIASEVEPFMQVHLCDADCPQIVKFQPSDLQAEVLGHVAEHRVLLSALQNFLQECPNVSWLCPATVTKTIPDATGVEIQLCAREHSSLQVKLPAAIRVRLMVAADGSRSPIRQSIGIQTHGWQYWQSCIVATIAPEKPHNNIAYERFWPSGPFAILPLSHNRCRIVWTAPHAEAQALLKLDDQKFLQKLRHYYGDQMGELSLVGQRFMFPAKLMHCDRYIQPRVALVGDAAHTCHPVGGQGLNLGIRDAAALAQVIQTAHQQGEDIGSMSVLKRYQQWRHKENLITLGFTDILNRLFSNHWLPLVYLRRFGLLLMQKLQPVKVMALKFMVGLSGRSPEISKH